MAAHPNQSDFPGRLHINQEEIGLEMALATSRITAFQRVVPKPFWQRRARKEFVENHCQQIVQACFTESFFVIAPELAGGDKFSHYALSDFKSWAEDL